MNKEITLRTITLSGNDYQLPEDMTFKQLSELIATLAALRPVCNRFKSIAGKWHEAHYLGSMTVSAGSRTLPQLFDSERAAEDHLKNLEPAAAHPESAF
jgi:hypothetical protein